MKEQRLTAKELLNNIATDDSLKEQLFNEDCVNSSYSQVFNQFRHIFNNLEIVDTAISTTNLSIITRTLSDKKTNLPIETIKATYNQIIHDFKASNFSILFTDASVGSSSTGIAVFNAQDNSEHAFKLDFKSSSSYGEMIAILQALLLAKDRQYTKVAIFTDSLIACQLLTKERTQNHLIATIHNTIAQADFVRVTIIWTPSHKAIAGNEKADQIAKDAINSNNILQVKLTKEEAIRRIRDEIENKWYEEVLAFSAIKPNLLPKFSQQKSKSPGSMQNPRA